MEKTEDEFKMGGKSLLIKAKVNGFRRGGIAHSDKKPCIRSVNSHLNSWDRLWPKAAKG